MDRDARRRSFLFLLVACALGASSAAAGELVVWHSYRAEERAAIEKVVAAYNKDHPGTTVTTLAVPFDAIADKISAAVPRGKGPDIFIYAQDRLGGWIEAGNTIEPIDFFLDDATKARYLPTTMAAMTYRGQTWGLPLNYKVITLIYNKKLVKAPPKDTAELVKLCKSLTDKASGRFGLAYAYTDYYYHAALQNGFGGGVFAGGAKPQLNSKENLAALELLLRWQDKDQFLPTEPSVALITALFNEGKAAMVFSGPWFLGEIAKEVDWGLAPLPNLVEAGGKPIRPWMTVEGVFISAQSKNKDVAYDFAKYLTDLPSAKIMALDGRQSPANKAVYDDAKVAADPVLKAFKQQVDVAVPMPNLPEMTMVWGPATTMMNAVTKHGATPKAGLDTAQAAVANAISQLKKKK
ncbi:MAG TPA: extracellular solute-binding protein [Haliangiales bacterium]|nr:extracellular solute-binding protein [Haliangiales bacterium]